MPEHLTADAIKRLVAAMEHLQRQQRRRPLAGIRREIMKIALPGGSLREMDIEDSRIEEILRELGINPVEVIVARNGVIVSEEETAGSGDELKILRVVHGG